MCGRGGAARWVILIASSLQLLLSSGLVLGWMGFLLIFKGEGTFASLCAVDARALAGNSSAAAFSPSTVRNCEESDVHLAGIFAVAFAFVACAALPLGLFVDRCPPRLVGTTLAIGTAAGFLLLALADYPGRNLFKPGMALFSFFGSGIQLNLFHVANLFPRKKGLVIGLFTTLFGISALLPILMFHVWRWMEAPADADPAQQHNGDGSTNSDSRQALFLWYAVVLSLFVPVMLMIHQRFEEGDEVVCGVKGFSLRHPPTKQASDGASQPAILAVHSVQLAPVQASPALVATAPEERRRRRPLRADLGSADFLSFLAFFTLHFFRSLFWLGTVDLQVASVLHDAAEEARAGWIELNGWVKPFGKTALLPPAPPSLLTTMPTCARYSRRSTYWPSDSQERRRSCPCSSGGVQLAQPNSAACTLLCFSPTMITVCLSSQRWSI
eukprot:SAG11_NODE_1629_length_4547_cov_2.310701_2_plen_441_part_00